MGLGKSIQTIALIAHTLQAAFSYETNYQRESPESQLRGSHTTLLICLKGLMDNWEREIKLHTRQPGLKVMRWHDTNRTSRAPEEWYSADIILTTLGTLQNDQLDSLTYATKWYRVVIDKAHIIRNDNFSSRCVTALKAVNRLCLTGTPLHNKLGDLQMMLRFLHVTPFYKDLVWDTHIAQPVQRGNLAPFGVERKQKFQGGEFFKQLTNLRMTCNHPLLFRQIEQGVDAENQPINLIEQKLGIKLPDERIHNSKVRDAIPTDWKLSPKIADLVHMLQKKKSHGGGKSVIYTQWKSFIDCICRINRGWWGRFEHDMCGQGLFDAVVYLQDAHWNPQVVQQAVDRLHRIGQAKPVRVFHVVTVQSIEQHLYNVQKRKAARAKRVITLTVPTEELEKAEALRVEEFPTGDVSDLGDPNQCYRN
ncbi:uncharacterized protein MELLADRAFT_84184 [Melampsora larici-populina 98AG31]|uniref:Helicase ATP-binding domain-containing protein n=1 Tax=Melampsora larici-populina (strain 98AG31 / pathotype 3-4-7) TaxID=747676 RepID=F4SBU6_MELLP|nr:uncharacterized protein MELLADRAFT_84184 [Melampsora larici-populina 98AG31]EGF97890.1 hypothetical protein MELLADRAFT_84184 [Melampsora larici-populina 98AG31]